MTQIDYDSMTYVNFAEGSPKVEIFFNGVRVSPFCTEADSESGWVKLIFAIGRWGEARMLLDKPLSLGGGKPYVVQLDGQVEITAPGQFPDRPTLLEEQEQEQILGLPFWVDLYNHTLHACGLTYSWEFLEAMGKPDKTKVYQLDHIEGATHIHAFDLAPLIDEAGLGYIKVTKEPGDHYELEAVDPGHAGQSELAQEALNVITGIDVDDPAMYYDVATELRKMGGDEVADLIVDMVAVAKKAAGVV